MTFTRSYYVFILYKKKLVYILIIYMQMKYLILISLITYTYACPAKTDAEWKELGCVVENAAGTDASGLGIVEPYTQEGYGSCSISCTDGMWVITQTCATGFEESNCEICPVCVESSAAQTDQTICDANFYRNATDSHKCKPCPSGQKSRAGSTSCSAVSTNEDIKSMFTSSKTADATLADTVENRAKKRANYKALVKNLKTLIKANPNQRMALPILDVVVNSNFKQKLKDRNIANVEVVIPKTKTANFVCSNEKDVDLGTDEVAFSIELEDGEEALICSGDTQVTRLKRDDSNNDTYTAYCYGTNVTSSHAAGADYECNGKTYYVGSLEGDNTDVSCAQYKEEWLRNRCCSAYNAAICDPISQEYETAKCGTCS
jgi:hypothetical protein